MSRIERCVRCGGQGNWLGSWLCAACYGNPDRLTEQGFVALERDAKIARRTLQEQFGWYGGWGYRQREVSHGDR